MVHEQNLAFATNHHMYIASTGTHREA